MVKKLFFVGFLVIVVLAIVFHGLLLAAIGDLVVFEKTDFKRVDAVMVLSGGVPDRVLQARDLLLESKANLVFLTHPVASKQSDLLEQLGIRLVGSAEIDRQVLQQAEIAPERIIDLPDPCDSTKDEAEALRRYLRKRPLRSVALTTCKNHSYRAYLNFKKALEGTNVQLYSVPSRYCEYDPGAWWKDRDQIKTLYVELASLVAFFLGRA